MDPYGFLPTLVLIVKILFHVLLLPFYWLNAIRRAVVSGEGKKLNGQIIMITGAGNGLGREMTLQFVRQGALVVGVDIRKEDLDETVKMAEEITNKKGIVQQYTCDISDRKAVVNLRDAVLRKNGHLDILINNAGIIYIADFEGGDDAHHERTVKVNILGPYWMTRAFLPSMKSRRKGHIVFISSVSAIIPDKNLSTYSATKAATTAFGQTLRMSLESDKKWDNIKVTIIHPYVLTTADIIITDFQARLAAISRDSAVAAIINAVRNEHEEIVIPGGEIGNNIFNFIRAVPKNLRDVFVNGNEIRFNRQQDVNTVDSFVNENVSYKKMKQEGLKREDLLKAELHKKSK